LEDRTPDTALEEKQILIPPNSPSPAGRVAFILDDGAPIEVLELLQIRTAGGRDTQLTRRVASIAHHEMNE
jgi:hypothetical protein